MSNKLSSSVNNTLNTRITPLAYLYAVKSIIFGVSYGMLARYSDGVTNTTLYKEGALIGHNLWGLLVLAGGGILLVGMLMKSPNMVKVSALVLFMAWAFATIVYITGGFLIMLLPLAVIDLLSCGYLYLAASLGILWDYTPSKTNWEVTLCGGLSALWSGCYSG